MLVPNIIYSINDMIARYLVDYLREARIDGVLNSVVQDYLEERIIVTNGHDESIAHLPSIVVESSDEIHKRVATGMMTQTHMFNILCQVRRTQNTPAEQVIRYFASAVQQALYRIINFEITLPEGRNLLIWDIEGDATIKYGYKAAKQLRVALIEWSCKVDVPLSLLYLNAATEEPIGAAYSETT